MVTVEEAVTGTEASGSIAGCPPQLVSKDGKKSARSLSGGGAVDLFSLAQQLN